MHALSILFFLFLTLFSVSTHAGLPGSTIILTAEGPASIESVAIDTKVLGYSLEKGHFCSANVEKNRSFTTTSLIEICTPQATFYASPSQQFYDYNNQSFIAAEKLSSQSLLINKNGEKIPCLSIKEIEKACVCYELSLSSPHLFFSSDLNLLTHNYASAFPAIVTSLVELAKIGSAIACFYFAKNEKNLPIKNGRPQKEINFIPHQTLGTSTSTDWKAIQKAADSFKASGTALIPRPKEIPLNGKAPDIFLNVPGEICGIRPLPNLFDNIISNHQQLGPMCLVGNITSTGDVECGLYILSFDGKELNGSPRYVWKLLGDNILRRHDPFVKIFVEAQDEKVLTEVKAFVDKTWKDVDLRSKTLGFYDALRELIDDTPRASRVILGSSFFFSALNAMAKKHISPFRVLQAIHYGTCKQANDPQSLLYCSQSLDIATAVLKQPRIIMSVGFLRELNEIDPPEKEEEKKEDDLPATVEDILKGATPGEETNGPATLYNKPGDKTTAEKDFNSAKPTAVKEISTDYGPAKIGDLPDRRKIIYRAGSSDGRPTLEIQRKTPSGKTRSIKIRYGANNNKRNNGGAMDTLGPRAFFFF